MKKTYSRVLTIAGSDSGGGAGIQADIKTISAMGCYAASAITAITAQNTQTVKSIHGVPVELVEDQIDHVLKDIGADAIKIGMLYSKEIIQAVKNMLVKYAVPYVVLDPVMLTSHGEKLIHEEAIQELVNTLFPLATLITPNLDEAALLLGKALKTYEDKMIAVQELLSFGSYAVLLKGGHESEEIIADIYFDKDMPEPTVITHPRVATNNTHGTGCSLASAIASALALGKSVNLAVRMGINYVYEGLLFGKDYLTGEGHGPINHFYKPQILR